MGLFFDLLSSINNPNQAGSVEQLSQITNNINDIASNNNIDPSTMQGVMSSLGPVLGTFLKEKGVGDNNPLDNIVGQFTGGGTGLPGGLGLESMMAGPLINTISEKTGLDRNLLETVVPKLIPVVMNLLNMGKTTGGVGGGNPLVNAFLDSDKDGDVDLGDVFKFANRFMNPQ
jgi:hypothetical protein